MLHKILLFAGFSTLLVVTSSCLTDDCWDEDTFSYTPGISGGQGISAGGGISTNGAVNIVGNDGPGILASGGAVINGVSRGLTRINTAEGSVIATSGDFGVTTTNTGIIRGVVPVGLKTVKPTPVVQVKTTTVVTAQKPVLAPAAKTITTSKTLTTTSKPLPTITPTKPQTIIQTTTTKILSQSPIPFPPTTITKTTTIPPTTIIKTTTISPTITKTTTITITQPTNWICNQGNDLCSGVIADIGPNYLLLTNGQVWGVSSCCKKTYAKGVKGWRKGDKVFGYGRKFDGRAYWASALSCDL